MRQLFIISLWIAIGMFCLPVLAKVQYQITVDKPEHHLAEINIQLPLGQDVLNLSFSGWRTGRYKIINSANGVRQFSALDEKGNALNWTRIDKSRWQVKNPRKGRVKVSYQLYANELGSRSRHIDSTHAYLDATAVLMYEPSLISEVHNVKLNVPKAWKSYSGMTEIAPHEFIAQSFHQLASSPIESGINQLRQWQVDGRQYQLVIWGKGNYDSRKMAKDLKSLVSQGKKVWKDYPFKKYLFIVHATSGAKGATEHINSTVIQKTRFSFAPRKDYLKFLRTAAHEFVHTWNVKAYRPAELVPYDYQKENYTRLLWVAEGSTSYFQDQLLLMAKLEKPKEFLTELSERIDDFQHRPGGKVQSVSDASFEAWIAQRGDFANNHSANIYSEGYMASWLLDFKMLQDSDLKSGYKQLHNELFGLIKQNPEEYKKNRAVSYNAEMMISIANKLTGEDYKAWWQRNINKPFSIDFEDMLDNVGLRFVPLKNKDYKPWMGFKSETEKGWITFTEVEMDGPAWKAGLTIGDQLVAINGIKVIPDKLKKQLESYKAGNELKLVIFRNDQLFSKTLTLGKITKKPAKIEFVESPSNRQKRFFKAWTGIEYPAKKEKKPVVKPMESVKQIEKKNLKKLEVEKIEI